MLWQCWLSRVPEGTGLFDILQFNPTHFDHKGIVGLRATRELSVQVQVILKLFWLLLSLAFSLRLFRHALKEGIASGCEGTLDLELLH